MRQDQRWTREQDAIWLYRRLASRAAKHEHQHLFSALAAATQRQADLIAASMSPAERATLHFSPSIRVRLVATLVRLLGPARARTILAPLKIRGLSVYRPAPAHHAMPSSLADFGQRHQSGNNLRPAVFGLNDGLLSNTSLVLGTLGSMHDQRLAFLSGVAGLVGGALSMAAGEYLSVRSQLELYEYQIAQERAELIQFPAEEAEELALIYQARGMTLEAARELAAQLVREPERALRVLTQDELGLNPDDLGSPWSAARTSLLSFAVGAAVPLVVLSVSPEPLVGQVVGVTACICLFGAGAAVSLFSGQSALRGGLRMVALGLAAGGISFGLGKLLSAMTA